MSIILAKYSPFLQLHDFHHFCNYMIFTIFATTWFQIWFQIRSFLQKRCFLGFYTRYNIYYYSIFDLNYIFYHKTYIYPPDMRRRSDVSFRSHIGGEVAYHAETSSWRSNWYVNETPICDVFATSHWYVHKTNQFET